MDFPHSDAGARLHEGEFTDGNPALGIPASIDKAEHMNALYRENRNLLIALGITPDEHEHNQLAIGIPAAIADAVESVRGPVGVLLDTHAEIANSIGNDSNFSTNVYTAISNRAPLSHTHTPSQVGLSNIPNSLSQTIVNNANTLVSGACLFDYSQAVAWTLAGKQDNILHTITNPGRLRIPGADFEIKWGTVVLTSAAGVGSYLGSVIFPDAFDVGFYGAGMFLIGVDGDADYYATISTYNGSRNGFNWKLRKLTVAGAWFGFYIALGRN